MADDSDTATAPHIPVFDTGDFEAPVPEEPSEPSEPSSAPLPVPAHSITVPGSYQYLKRWTFVAVVAGVWIVAAAAGLGLYSWWYQATDKTWPVFGVLSYLIVCTVAGLLAAMAQGKPKVSAMAIALMSAPLASTAAAAALYGAYVFGWIAR
ncbi:hypothetical protein M1247_11935 [Mycobacterium sp. 21AC1]|uniref:hypothetical protein n=1 Tax=[Mycobacterium] appelbergii TaxID=2939269 RepID=UPI002938DF08|nr:hypothetical protein [Mycobacterium sp. 21AC1]MDV3125626.1 hypothetical protein [Mycobacterium sp. 21AC1]